MATDTNSLWSYMRLVKSEAFKDFGWPRDMLIATVIAGTTAFIQVHYGLVDLTHSKAFWLSVLSP